MTIKIEDINKLPFRQEYCEETEQKLIEILNSNPGLNMKELLWCLGHLLIDVGMSLEGDTSTVDYKKIYRDYYKAPSLGKGLAAQGVHLISAFLENSTKESEVTDGNEQVGSKGSA